MKSFALSLALTLTLLGAGSPLVHAQTSPAAAASNPLLKGKDVNEDNLIDALAIEGPQAVGATRGFRPAPAGAKPKAYGPGRANLLITFISGSSDLTADAKRVIATLAKAMQSDTLAGLSFRIEGHADATGSEDHNKNLSQARAEAVAKELADAHGVLGDRLKAEGRGSAEPLNKAKVDAPENRRVTIVSVR
jgi:outer membrane protein OmpA-like peptidoglycan-associated protein